MRKPASRKALYGWLFFTPPVVVIIGVLACEAYLNIETRKNDYEVAKLKQQADTLNDALAKLRGSSAASQQLQKLQEQALAMGLRDPEPWQIERVDMAAPLLPASAFEIARIIPAPPPMPKKQEPDVVAAPEPAVEPAPETIAPFAPMEGNAVLATAPEPIELELLEAMPVQNEHVAQLEETPPKQETAEEMVAPSRAPLAAPLASPNYDVSPATTTYQPAPNMQAASAPGSLDESVESMLAL